MSGNSDEPVPPNGVDEPEQRPIEEPVPESETEAEPKPEPQSEPNPEPLAEAVQQPEPEPPGVADREPDGPKESSIRSNDDSRSSEVAYPELRKDQGSRTFTMRELLSGLKTDQGSDGACDTPSPYRFAFSVSTRILMISFSLAFSFIFLMILILKFRFLSEFCVVGYRIDKFSRTDWWCYVQDSEFLKDKV